MAGFFGQKDSFDSKSVISIGSKDFKYWDLNVVAEKAGIDLKRLPNSLKVLLENVVRFEDGVLIKKDLVELFKRYLEEKKVEEEIAFRPTRVLMQDFTGVPAVVDIAAMRDTVKLMGGNPENINPEIPVDLVIDHSVQVDEYASRDAIDLNVALEMERNQERYRFLHWGQESFKQFRVVPPGTGICHQVNLEYLASVVWSVEKDGDWYAYPDTLVGTDSHTTMVNALSVLGWGVGGIEAEAAMLGQAITMMLPEVIGVKFIGKLREGITATDLVLHVTNVLREKNVVGKFVEYFGEGLENLTLSDRATLSNMAPEYGATCGFFPIDDETLKYLELTARSSEQIELVEKYAKIQRLWRSEDEMVFSDEVEIDLSKIDANLAGPKRPQDKIALQEVKDSFKESLPQMNQNEDNVGKEYEVDGRTFKLKNGDVVISAITSCTNTSNPSVMIAAGLLAKNASERGLSVKPWVKTSLAPGSKVVSEYLERSGLQRYLDGMGFNLVGYGCTTCIGNSGPLDEDIEKAVQRHKLVVASVLSGNRNFEGRIHPSVRANFLASPPLCVAFAIAGTVNIDLEKEPLGVDLDNRPVFLKDIWPSQAQIDAIIEEVITPQMFKEKYSDLFVGPQQWRKLNSGSSKNYSWDSSSTYIKRPNFFDEAMAERDALSNIKGARILALFGDSITTDHISPAGSIPVDGPAGMYLKIHGVEPFQFNSFGSRRGNHEVMVRGTFANVRIKNKMAEGKEGGYTKYMGKDEIVTIYDAAMKYAQDDIPLVVFAGKEYGTGSSRDWAAKGTKLLGVKAVIAESFERIHRSNLVGMGVMPFVFKNPIDYNSLKLKGDEEVAITGIEEMTPGQKVECIVTRDGERLGEIDLISRIDTDMEMKYVKAGGILNYVLKKKVKSNAA
jgi:aconitate hydratase